MGRLWNILVNMENDRLTKNVFMWDKSHCKCNWSYEMKQLFSNNGFENTFKTNSCVNVKLMHNVLHQHVDYVQCVKKMLLNQNPTFCCIVVNITS